MNLIAPLRPRRSPETLDFLQASRVTSAAVRVLLLEDHEGSRFVTRHALRSLGHECMAVGDMQTALLLMSSFAPDVVIYEWNTRKEQRIGLAAKFRELAPSGALLLIALSAVEEPLGFRERETIDGYLTKPFRPRDLISLLRPRQEDLY